MKDLLDHIYEAPVVAEVTGLDLIEQRRAMARGLFASGSFVAEPRAGHPRRFSLLSVYECGLLAMAKRSGFDSAFPSLAMYRRLVDAGLGTWATPPRAVDGTSVTYDPERIKHIAAKALPEFADPRAKPGFWSVKYVVEGGERDAAWVKWGPLSQAYADEPDAGPEVGVMTWPISHLVRTIDRGLTKAVGAVKGLNPE